MSTEEQESLGERVEEVVEEAAEHVEAGVRDIERELLAEVRSLHQHLNLLHRHHEELHAKVDTLQHQQRAYGVYRHHWLSHIIHDLEYEPRVQRRIHLVAAWVWLVSAIPILILFFFFPEEWLAWGVLITLLYSLYANFSTDYSGISAAQAAMGTHPMPEVPLMQRERGYEEEHAPDPQPGDDQAR
jgi:VIT1/CCC1 family predicted Fe2+/Mn2+ transporter